MYKILINNFENYTKIYSTDQEQTKEEMEESFKNMTQVWEPVLSLILYHLDK